MNGDTLPQETPSTIFQGGLRSEQKLLDAEEPEVSNTLSKAKRKHSSSEHLESSWIILQGCDSFGSESDSCFATSSSSGEDPFAEEEHTELKGGENEAGR